WLRIVLFFFSSRRRHTRWPRDWSSDVCSSDLPRMLKASTGNGGDLVPLAALAGEAGSTRLIGARGSPPGRTGETPVAPPSSSARSEERRVGKGCRSGVWPED